MESEMCAHKAVSFMCSPYIIHPFKPVCGCVPWHGPTAIPSPADWCICSVLVPSTNNHVSAIKQFCYLHTLMEFSCKRLWHWQPNSEDVHPPGVCDIASPCVKADVRPDILTQPGAVSLEQPVFRVQHELNLWSRTRVQGNFHLIICTRQFSLHFLAFFFFVVRSEPQASEFFGGSENLWTYVSFWSNSWTCVSSEFGTVNEALHLFRALCSLRILQHSDNQFRQT